MTRCSAQAQSKHTTKRVPTILLLDVDLRSLHCDSCAALVLRVTVKDARPSRQKTKHMCVVLCRGFFVASHHNVCSGINFRDERSAEV